MPELVVAVDINKSKFKRLARKILPYVKYFKIGHKLFTEYPRIIKFLNIRDKKVFLDLKYHDIPSVVADAIKTVSEKYRPYALTLHISSGKKTLLEAVKARNSLPVEIQPKLFGVTILTSLDNKDLRILGMSPYISNQVKKMVRIAQKCKLDGIVCSGKEVKMVKNIAKKLFILAPGLKIISKRVQFDQKRTVEFDKIKKYVDFVVVGREIWNSKNPVEIIKKISETLKK